MKVMTRQVYYCEYCGAHRFQKPAMERHEVVCTANVHRKCGVCERTGEWYDVPAIVKELKKSADAPTIAEIRKLVGGCPACMLTIVRALCLNIEWSYQAEHDKFWQERNADEVYYY